MVALAENSADVVGTVPRARAQNRSGSSSASRCSKSLPRTSLREQISGRCSRLEPCSRDPIGYEGSKWNFYAYVNGRCAGFTDAMGEQITPLPPNTPSPYTPGLPKCNVLKRPTTNPVELWIGTGYGFYCGLFRRGDGKKPIDPLDEACKRHDECVAKVADRWKWIGCASILCFDAYDARKRGCAKKYPNDPRARSDCEWSAWLVQQWACAQSQNNPEQPKPTWPKSRAPCFDEGTLVWTPMGHAKIKDVEVGDVVYSFDIRTSEVVETEVIGILCHESGPYALNFLTVSSDTLAVTDGHPMFDGKLWILSHEIGKREFLSVRSTTEFVRVDVVHCQRLPNGTERVYNLLTQAGNYIVTKQHIIVSGTIDGTDK